MDLSAKRRVVEKLIKQTFDRLGIKAEILPYNKDHGDRYMFEVDIYVDSSKYHQAGPNHVKNYDEYIDYIEDLIGEKLKTYGLDDFYVNPNYKHINFEWAQDKVLKIIKDIFNRWDISDERIIKSFSIGKGRCHNSGSVRPYPYTRPYLHVCVNHPLDQKISTSKLTQILSLQPELEDFFVKNNS